MGRTKGQIENLDFGGLSDEDLHAILSHSGKTRRTRFRDLRSLALQNSEQGEGSSADQTSEEDIIEIFEGVEGYKLGIFDTIEKRVLAAEEIANESLPSEHQTPENHQKLKAQRKAALEEVEIWKTIQIQFEKFCELRDSAREETKAPENLVTEFKALFPPLSFEDEGVLEDLISNFWDRVSFNHSKGEFLEESKIWEALVADRRDTLRFCHPEGKTLGKAAVWENPSIDFSGLLRPYLLEREAESKNEDPVDLRRGVLETYLDLKTKFGRLPFRTELEKTHLQSTSSPKGQRSVSMAATRLGLPLGDTRVYAQLKKSFGKRNTKSSGNPTRAEHLETLEHTFSQLKIKSPEATRLRESLLNARFERLLAIVGNRKIFESIETEATEGFKFENCEPSSEFARPSEMSVTRMINGSEKAYDLLIALKSFSKLWARTHLWAFDFSWIRLGLGSDYGQATDAFSLTDLRHSIPEREAGEWLAKVAKIPPIRDLVLRCWPPFSLLEGLPFAPNSQRSARILIDLFQRIKAPTAQEGAPSFPRCRHLAEIDADFRVLLDFLNPYDLLLKGEEYGFPFPPRIGLEHLKL